MDENDFVAQFEEHRSRLRRMLDLRLDPRLRGRVDASDILQETSIEALKQRDDYDSDRMPFYLWLRMIALRRMIDAGRRHLGSQKRAVGNEISLHRPVAPHITSESLAAQLMGKLTSASEVAHRAELKLRLQQLLNSMDDLDREVLTLRHFEHLTNSEVASVLGISINAASNRYIRALHRLRKEIEDTSGLIDSNIF